MGITGTCIALTMQIWMNAYEYPYIISGKPYISLPAFIPVAFELTILLASFGTFFGMWGLNGLPRFSNPIFSNPRFDRVTDDTFFLYIGADDERYDRAGVEKLMADAGGQHIAPVIEDDSPAKIPRFLMIGLATVISLSMIPLLVVAQMRVTTSSQPRFHVFYDMDFSPAKDLQQTSTLFADFRAMRPDVPGTVARGNFNGNLNYTTGIDLEELAKLDAPRAERLVAAYPQDDAEQAVSATADSDVDTTPWLTENPVELTVGVLERGQQQFKIYCSVCHGFDGRGNGLVTQRAQRILATTWTPPSNMNDPLLYADKYPDGKLFSTITNGVRKMPGYASQIKARDRWAIVAYVRALQRSQNASIDLVPAAEKAAVIAGQEVVEERLEEEAEAERLRLEEAAAKKAAEEAVVVEEVEVITDQTEPDA